jgi:hypothetical protein
LIECGYVVNSDAVQHQQGTAGMELRAGHKKCRRSQRRFKQSWNLNRIGGLELLPDINYQIRRAKVSFESCHPSIGGGNSFSMD